MIPMPYHLHKKDSKSKVQIHTNMNTVHGSHEDRVGLLVLRIPALIIITIYTEFRGAVEKLALHLAHL